MSKSLSLVAQAHADDMAKNKFQGHQGSDGSSLEDRFNRKCLRKKFGLFAIGENIGGDFQVKGRNHALNTIKGLIIDDGVSNRGHRRNIFSTDFECIGVGSSSFDKKLKL